MINEKRINAMKLAKGIMFFIGAILFTASLTIMVFFLGVTICCDDIITEQVVNPQELYDISTYYSDVMVITCFTLSAIGGVCMAIYADLRIKIENWEDGLIHTKK